MSLSLPLIVHALGVDSTDHPVEFNDFCSLFAACLILANSLALIGHGLASADLIFHPRLGRLVKELGSKFGISCRHLIRVSRLTPLSIFSQKTPYCIYHSRIAATEMQIQRREPPILHPSPPFWAEALHLA